MTRLVLGIESTAHTFGVGACTYDGDIVYNRSSTYITTVGGIHPREAARHHADVAPGLIHSALEDLKGYEIDAVSVALGPGLGPCLRVGAVSARALAIRLNVPLIAVNHALAHIEIGVKHTATRDPVSVYISGGNTAVVIFSNGRYAVAGETLDISLGNMLDVFARDLGFGYPGTPHVLELAAKGKNLLDLPMAVKGQDVSFSGLLTSAERLLKSGADPADLAYSVVETSFAMVTEVTERVLVSSGKKEVSLTGGVARASRLVQMLETMCRERGVGFSVVPPELSGDNGAMIAYVGQLYASRRYSVEIPKSFVRTRWRLEEAPVVWK